MFLRFVHAKPIKFTAARRGFFAAAEEALENPIIDANSLEQINEHFEWFRVNLATPPSFSRTNSKGAWRRELTLGLSWFRHDATSMLDRAWELTAILKEQGYAIDVIKSSRIGFVIYQDEHQVVAEPFKDTPV